jgi:hypothetical protein
VHQQSQHQANTYNGFLTSAALGRSCRCRSATTTPAFAPSTSSDKNLGWYAASPTITGGRTGETGALPSPLPPPAPVASREAVTADGAGNAEARPHSGRSEADASSRFSFRRHFRATSVFVLSTRLTRDAMAPPHLLLAEGSPTIVLVYSCNAPAASPHKCNHTAQFQQKSGCSALPLDRSLQAAVEKAICALETSTDLWCSRANCW